MTEGERGEGEERERGIVIMHRYALVQPQLRHAVQTSLLKFHGPPQQQLHALLPSLPMTHNVPQALVVTEGRVAGVRVEQGHPLVKCRQVGCHRMEHRHVQRQAWRRS